MYDLPPFVHDIKNRNIYIKLAISLFMLYVINCEISYTFVQLTRFQVVSVYLHCRVKYWKRDQWAPSTWIPHQFFWKLLNIQIHETSIDALFHESGFEFFNSSQKNQSLNM